MNKNRGFSLLELLIVMSVIVVLTAVGVGFYMNYGKTVDINSIVQVMASNLKETQSRSMINEGNFKWGMHFVNVSGGSNYYEIFSTPTDYTNAGKVILSTNYLSSGVTFSDPASGLSKNIIFNKISGGTSPDSVSLVAGTITKTINVSSIGSISIQ